MKNFKAKKPGSEVILEEVNPYKRWIVITGEEHNGEVSNSEYELFKPLILTSIDPKIKVGDLIREDQLEISWEHYDYYTELWETDTDPSLSELLGDTVRQVAKLKQVDRVETPIHPLETCTEKEENYHLKDWDIIQEGDEFESFKKGVWHSIPNHAIGETFSSATHRPHRRKLTKCEMCQGYGELSKPPYDDSGICPDCKGTGETPIQEEDSFSNNLSEEMKYYSDKIERIKEVQEHKPESEENYTRDDIIDAFESGFYNGQLEANRGSASLLVIDNGEDYLTARNKDLK